MKNKRQKRIRSGKVIDNMYHSRIQKLYKPFASTFHASVAGNIVAIVHEGLLQNGTTFPVYNATRPASVATTTSKHGLGNDVELSQPEDDEFGKRKLRTEILRTSRANHFASNE